jgi:allantoate deiminase
MTKTGPSQSVRGDNRGTFGAHIVERIEQLARISDDPAALTRLYLSPSHKTSIELVAGWMRAAGMAVHVDALATVVGRYEAAQPGAPTLLIGSHIDTVRDAGRFDGTLGVLAGIAVVEHVAAQGRRLPFAIEVIAFGDEEGVRFPGTLTASRAIAGRFDARTLDEADRDGVTRRDALSALGCDVSAIGAIARDPSGVLGYIEAHIEQGPVLQAEGLPVGIVTAINGGSRGRITVTGEAGHAGTVPMSMRADALAGAAAMILAIERLGQETPDLVATVGVVDVVNGAVNAVPGQVTFTIDVRSPSDDVRHAAVAAIKDRVRTIAEARRIGVSVDMTYDAPAAPCAPPLTAALVDAVQAVGLPVKRLASGAGHDAMSFKDVIPFTMLFVRCRDGISHNPLEHATTDDIDVAVRVLIDAVDRLAATR